MAAGELVLREAGGAVTDLAGRALGVGSLKLQSVLATLDPELHRAWRAWLDGRR
jgi:myo-inositol-1(or 4)-monophosphatase